MEHRALCDPVIFDATVKRKFGSDRNLAAYLGVNKEIARSYRLGRLSLPVRFLKKLQTLNPALQPLMITDASWGQRKGADVRWHASSTRKRQNHSDKSRKHARRTDVLSPDEVGLYEVGSPSSLLQAALLAHRATLAEFVGRIFGDGSPILAPTYSASEVENQKRMQSLVVELFHYRPDIKIAGGHCRMQLRRNCGRTLQLLGIPFGRKSVTNPVVPSFIMESDDASVWLAFLRGIFDDEAYVSERGIEIGLAVRQLSTHALPKRHATSRILGDVAELLDRLGIRYVRRRGQTYRVGNSHAICWFLRIPRREFRKVRAWNYFCSPLSVVNF